MESELPKTLMQVFILLIAPPFYAGIINKVKSVIGGRSGPPILQLYFDIWKQFGKGAVFSKSTSVIFRTAPVVILAATLSAGIIVPTAGRAPVSFPGDLVLFVYFLALSRFLTVSAAMDTASSFEGMGASREATFGALSELTIFTVVIALAVVTRSLSLSGIFESTGMTATITDPPMILLAIAFFAIILTENSRMPVDDPNTHLELTMIHEVMILDYSGPDLGIMLYAASMKLFIFMAFVSLLLFSNATSDPFAAAGLLLLKVTGIAIAIGVVESISARIRLVRIPHFLIATFVLATFALIVALFGRGNL